ncbi:hypothetical protein [Paracidovorax wautersii]|uniref:Uncharacterized protein n=1 Tax=Paracidovorax wautersii TaxID=1177982 RepID=A0ABU1IIT5_9BURK|nr:hypothetical protein [Paracidovorax wautersii]MDR6216189.1 hypothetical protein [Paracidovorax wautersii]
MLNENPRTLEEAYASAANSSDLRCETRDGAPRADTDLLIAAGWSQSRVGGALLRLHTEWDGAEHARVASAADFLQTAQARRPDAARAPQTAAQVKASAAQLAQHANAQQAKLLMGHLKTLAPVREQLALQLSKWKVADAHAVAIAVLRWWLAPACGACEGRKFELIPGTGRLSSKVCKCCGATGKARVPHGEPGRKLANWMDDSVAIARASMSKRLRMARS